jgi:hypothetical protein
MQPGPPIAGQQPGQIAIPADDIIPGTAAGAAISVFFKQLGVYTLDLGYPSG